eukprot:1752208-Prorocentrum_lima.AAC.1
MVATIDTDTPIKVRRRHVAAHHVMEAVCITAHGHHTRSRNLTQRHMRRQVTPHRWVALLPYLCASQSMPA